MKRDGTKSWVVFSRGIERYVTELALDHTEPKRLDENTLSIGRLVAWKSQSSASSSSQIGSPIEFTAISPPELREPDGAVEGESLLNHYKRSHFPEDVSQWGSQEWIDRLQRGRNKTKFESCVNALDGIQYMRPLQKGTPQQSESMQGCTRMGLISFITLGHQWIGDLLPMPVCSLEGLVEIEDGNSASSRQWALCTSLALIHRVPWNSRRWFHTRQLETASRRNFIFDLEN